MRTPLVLLPGLICDERLWRDVIGGLGNTVEAIVADLTQGDSIAQMASHALAVAPPRFALAGLSMGGYVAMEIMRQAPERVSHLALLDTMARPDDEARRANRLKGIDGVEQGRFVEVTKGMLASLLAPQHLDTAVADEVQTMSERVGPQVYIRQQKAIMERVDSRPGLKEIGVPTLVGVGEMDVLIPPELSREIAEGIAGAELVTFPGSGHLPTMENPEAVTAAMRGWLGR